MSAVTGPTHLDPRIHSLARAGAAERIRMIERDLFIEHDYSRHLSATLDELLAGPRQIRMPCLLIVGDAGMGKTAQLHRFHRLHPDGRDCSTDSLIRTIVIANVPPEPTRLALLQALLTALDAPTPALHRLVNHAAVVRRMLGAYQTRIVVFDEIQHVCRSRARDRAVVLDSIKSISTENQVNVVCTGTREVEQEFRADAQLERRFEITRFAPWSNSAQFRRFLATYERIRPLRLPSRLVDPEMTRAILEEAGGVTHRIVQRLNAAAMVAIHEGIERITPELICVQRTEPARVHAARKLASAQAARGGVETPRAVRSSEQRAMEGAS